MFNKKLIFVASVIILSLFSNAFCQSVEDNWDEFLHYTRIGRLDMAKGYAQNLLEQNPEPTELLDLADDNPRGYAMLIRMNDTIEDQVFKQLTDEILGLIEEGRFIRRTSPKVIAEEIRRLSSTERGKLNAVKRLKNSGEYAIPYMLDALADEQRKDEFSNIVWALPQIGKEAIRPLVAALQMDNIGVKAEIIKALGEIKYPQSLPYLKYVVENESSEMLKEQAISSIMMIKPAAMDIPAAKLFYELGEKYYYHTESLQPKEDFDFANIWFWNENDRTLYREEVPFEIFNEMMAMRTNEWALKADVGFARAIGLWLASFFKAEQTGLKMPEYFGDGHADAYVYATTAGPEYIHASLARALKDENSFIALGSVEALAATAGEASLLYSYGVAQPLMQAVKFDDKAVKYSASIAIANANPVNTFAERHLVVTNLAKALASSDNEPELQNKWSDTDYSLRAARVINKLASTRNKVIELSRELEAIIEATEHENPEIQRLSCDTLAYFGEPQAQQAIADMAFNEDLPVEMRINAFGCLASSAKVNGSKLSDETIDDIYNLLSSNQAASELRTAAASAYGALNLPSRKVKDLVLDQAKS